VAWNGGGGGGGVIGSKRKRLLTNSLDECAKHNAFRRSHSRVKCQENFGWGDVLNVRNVVAHFANCEMETLIHSLVARGKSHGTTFCYDSPVKNNMCLASRIRGERNEKGMIFPLNTTSEGSQEDTFSWVR